MSNKHYKLWIMLLLIAICGNVSAQTLKIRITPTNSEIKVSGTSNIHDWEMMLKSFEISITLKDVGKTSATISGTSFSGEAASLESSYSLMTNKAQKALKAKENPLIIFKQTEDVTINYASGAAPVVIKGNLTIAGITQPIEIEAVGQKIGNDAFKATGSSKIKMSDFGIKPQTALLGTLKTHDGVTINVDITYNHVE